jgi:hypothetical protein
MLRKVVARVQRVHLHHDPVARHLGDHAGRGDAEAQSIAADQRGLWEGEWQHGQAVDQGMVGRERKRGDGAAHCFVARAQNVQAVDFLSLDYGRGPSDLAVGGDFRKKLLTLSRGQLLGVIEFPVTKVIWQQHGGGYDRACERAAPRLVDPHDSRPAGLSQRAFVPEAAAHPRWVSA